MKKICVFVIIFISMFLSLRCVDAANGSLSIWANANTVTVGSNVTISVKAGNLTGKFKITSSDSGVLSGGKNEEWIENDTNTYTFTAKSAGKATITVSAISVNHNDDYSEFGGSKSVTINVVNKSSSNGGSSGGKTNNNSTTSEVKEYSSDNSLSSLSVDGYELNPKFSKDVYEYKLEVDEKVEKINVKASANDKNASVKGTGEIKLTPGENTIEVKVIAENGNEKIYKLGVTVKDLHPINVSIDNKKYTIVKKNNDIIAKLDYFDEEVIKIDDEDVVSYYNKNTKVRLVILKDEDNKVKYYIYNEQEKKYSLYKFITVGGVSLQLVDAPVTLDNYKKFSIMIGDMSVDIYKIMASHKVGLVYGTNNKTGNTGFYVYDENEGTLGKYYDEETKLLNERLISFKNKTMLFMGIASFVAILCIIFSMISGKKKRRHNF